MNASIAAQIETPLQAKRTAALDALHDLAAQDRPLPQEALRVLSDWCDGWVGEAPPLALVARPCPVPAARWHFDRLCDLDGRADGETRRAYHARMLGYLLAPGRAMFRPLVTVLIPVYNRAGMVAEAVESCLAQEWRPLEILVVDDGSTDDPAAALARFGDQVRILSQANGGVSSARNAGLAAARGDFIHFLDSDNLLLPGAIGAKVAAFAAIADAELCFSAAQSSKSGATPDKRAPSGGPECATTDLLRAVAQRYPFFVSTTMLARWAALEAPRFAEDLRYHEDLRYWFTLGLRSTKAIGLRSRLTLRRNAPDRLSAQVTRNDPVGTIVRLRGLRDMLADPRHWALAAPLFARLLHGADWRIAAASGEPAQRAMRELETAFAALGRPRSDGLSSLPLIGTLRHALWHAVSRARFDGAADPMLRACAEALAQAARHAPTPSQRDVAHWRQLFARVRVIERLRPWIDAVEHALGDPAALGSLAWMLRHSWRIPRKRGLRRLLLWQRWLKSPWLARRLALARFGVRSLPQQRRPHVERV